MYKQNSIWKWIRTKIAPASALVFYLSSSLPADAQGTVYVNPGDNIQNIVNAHSAGTTYIIKAGEHRMQQVLPKTGDTFLGEVGTDGSRLTILNGSRLLTNWVKEGNYWVHYGQSQEGWRFTSGCLGGYPRCNYPEDLYKNDYPMPEESDLANLGPGEWFFDYDNDKLYMYDDPSSYKMEISVSRYAFGGMSSNNNNVTVKNFIIEKYATPGHLGTVGEQFPGTGWLIENNEIRLNHGGGINFKDYSIVRGNYVHHNGQIGMFGKGVKGLVENNEISYNTLPVIGYAWDFEGGGTKFAVTDSLIVRNNYVHHNEGPGLWTDIRNIHTLYEGNTCTDNRCSGIFHEISYDAIIRCNTVARNKASHGAQIYISTSSNGEIYNNKVICEQGSSGGIVIMRQYRTNDAGPDFDCLNNYVHHNDITMSFLPTDVIEFTGARALYDAATFWASSNTRFDYNRYHVGTAGDQKFWHWNGARQTWAQFKSYGQEANGTVDNNLSPVTAPQVNAGTDQTITLPASTVTLNGTASSPFTSTILWTVVSAPNTPAFNYTNRVNPVVSNLIEGTYTFRLTNTDGCNNTVYDDVTVTVVDPTPKVTRYEAETNYTVLNDVGTFRTVQVHDCPGISNGKAVNIFDAGDKFRISFTVPETGTYRLYVQTRSGAGQWPNGYAFTLNGTTQPFTGDASTNVTNTCMGGGTWGVMHSNEVYLTTGVTHTLDIEAKANWAAVDYLDVKKIQTLYDAEKYYFVVNDVGTFREVGIHGCTGISNDKAVSLFDAGDKCKINFNVEEAGSYILSARTRSGSLWPNGYSFTVNGAATTFTGDVSTNVTNSCMGGGTWGVMSTIPVSLTKGVNTVEIAAVGNWTAVDYIEVKQYIPAARFGWEESTITSRSIDVYPNPFQEKITINLQEESLKGTYQVSISDGMGRICYKKSHSLQDGNTELDLSDASLAPGVYYLHLSNGSENRVLKILKR